MTQLVSDYSLRISRGIDPTRPRRRPRLRPPPATLSATLRERLEAKAGARQ